MAVQVTSDIFNATHGHELAGYRFDPESAARGVVVIAPALAIARLVGGPVPRGRLGHHWRCAEGCDAAVATLVPVTGLPAG